MTLEIKMDAKISKIIIQYLGYDKNIIKEGQGRSQDFVPGESVASFGAHQS